MRINFDCINTTSNINRYVHLVSTHQIKTTKFQVNSHDIIDVDICHSVNVKDVSIIIHHLNINRVDTGRNIFDLFHNCTLD